ncbi:MAG: phage scaffolding protein [Clostridia bacterium]|nr:phage scaffolding protein [Clostridia bacterium]
MSKNKNNNQIGKQPETKTIEKDESQKGIEELLKEKDKQLKEYEGRIEKMKFDSLLDEKLTGSRARNKQAVRALLDMEKIHMEGGAIIGADEQITAIKAKEGYLFESANTGSTNPSGTKERVDLESLSDSEFFKMKFNKQ